MLLYFVPSNDNNYFIFYSIIETEQLLGPVCSAAAIYGSEMINAGACCPFISANRPATVKKKGVFVVCNLKGFFFFFCF